MKREKELHEHRSEHRNRNKRGSVTVNFGCKTRDRQPSVSAINCEKRIRAARANRSQLSSKLVSKSPSRGPSVSAINGPSYERRWLPWRLKLIIPSKKEIFPSGTTSWRRSASKGTKGFEQNGGNETSLKSWIWGSKLCPLIFLRYRRWIMKGSWSLFL